MTKIVSHEALNQLYDAPHPLAESKEIMHLEEHAIHFIKHSPYAVIATTDKAGFNDVSPRGGEPGFVKVLDPHTLAFADMSGNNRLDSLRNLIDNPKMGLLFMIPGIGEIVRVQGSATLHTDEALLDRFCEGQKRPKLVVKITVETTLFHCPKAIAFAKLWSDDHKVDRTFLPSLLKIIQDQVTSSI